MPENLEQRMTAEAYRCERVRDSLIDNRGDMGPQARQQRRHHTARQRERGRADSGLVIEELLVWLVAGQAETRREVCDLLRGGTSLQGQGAGGSVATVSAPCSGTLRSPSRQRTGTVVFRSAGHSQPVASQRRRHAGGDVPLRRSSPTPDLAWRARPT